MHVSLCMCSYACVPMHVFLCMCSYACVPMHVSLCMCPYACVPMHVSPCMCPYACVRTFQTPLLGSISLEQRCVVCPLNLLGVPVDVVHIRRHTLQQVGCV